MSKRVKRKWHPDFVKYMDFIVHHKNYSDMPNKFKDNGEINWVSPSDKLRAIWWDAKKQSMGCNDRAEVARKIHPKELHSLKPCQICGRMMNINYVYPNKVTLKCLNNIRGIKKNYSIYEESIFEITGDILRALGESGYNALSEIFSIPTSVCKSKDDYTQYIVINCLGRLSPGTMSNPPDRLDGFHTYNACCRSKEDTGRHTGNLARYTQDRRAYENWADGNWNLANRLMGEYNKYPKKVPCPVCYHIKKVSADHIGPISLGFAHRPKFRGMCKKCNSKKNNRMTFSDIVTLINDEMNGDQVISWHSRFIWDMLKGKVSNDDDALKVSKIMRLNLHHILTALSIISEKGHNEFLLRYLHPEYSFVDYKFSDFDPIMGKWTILQKEIDTKNKRKNALRYKRISFEALDDYKNVTNRNARIWHSEEIDKLLDKTIQLIKGGKLEEADDCLKMTFQKLAEYNALSFC